MKRDVGYAVFAALSLSIIASVWAFFNASSLADPGEQATRQASKGSLPIVPGPRDTREAQDHALAVLRARDLFSAPEPADMASLRRLAKAKIAPPVQLTPVEGVSRRPPQTQLAPQRVVTAPPVRQPQPAPQLQPQPQLQALAPVPAPQRARPAPAPQATPRYAAIETPSTRQPQPQERMQVPVVIDPRFPLTLRGLFPDPRSGGRALIATSDGRVVSTGPGGVIAGFQVLRIDSSTITVQERGGRVFKLGMPGYGRL